MKKRISFCLLLLMSTFFVTQAQISLGPDVSFCAEDSATLVASGPYTNFSWSNGATGASIKVKTAGTYIVTAYTVGTTSNLVVNGDFQAGNVGFTSAYVYDPTEGSTISEGSYGITNRADNAHWDFQQCTDHTSGSGKMLVANGTKTLNQKLWCQTVTVDPNTNYDFSTSVGSATKDFPAIMQFSINNIAIGSNFNASATPCTWNTFNQAWNSGVNTSAQICIINKNTSSKGNDFMLDDIIFTKTDTVKVRDTIVVIVNQKPTVNLGTDKSGCSGSPLTLNAGNGFSSYVWSEGSTSVSSISVSTPGNYSVEVSDSKGCKNKDDINVGFSTNLKFSIGNDTTLCAETAAITLDAGAGFNTYSWNGGGNGQTKSVNSSGEYIVNVTSSNGCNGSDTINVTMNPVINVSVPNATVNICGGSNALLNPSVSGGAGSFTYLWTGAGSGTNPSYSASSAGAYSLTATDSKGCKNKIDITVTLSGNANVSLGNDTVICSPAAGLTLDAGAGFTSYAWSGGGSGQTKLINTSGQYIVNVSNNGCNDADTINILFNPAITLTFTGNTNSICNGNSALLNPTVSGGTGSFTYLWSDSGAGTNSTYTATSAGSYTLTATDSKGCKASSTKTLSTQTLSVNLLGGKDSATICTGESLVLDAGNTNGYTYLWSSKAKTQSIKVTNGGKYYVIVSNGNCKGTDTVTVEEISVPKNTLGDQLITCFKERELIALTSGVSDTKYTLLWSTGDSTSNININKEGTYSLKISKGSCESEDEIKIVDYCEGSLFVPNCFTPNGDHNNDEFKPRGKNVENFELLIFNRWGELIFSSANIEEGWNGSYKGLPVEEDVYVWKLSYAFDQESGHPLKKEQIGHVVLLR